MKKIIIGLFVSALLLLPVRSGAQLITGAGYLHSIESYKTTADGKKAEDSMHYNGFYVGASYNFLLGNFVGLAPGFYVDMLFKNTDNSLPVFFPGLSVTGSTRYTELALNLPVNLTVNYEVNDNTAIFAFMGPVLQFGLLSRTTFNVSGQSSIGTAGYGDAINHYKEDISNPFNVYMGGGFGLQVGDLQFMVGYDHSLVDCDRLDGISTRRNQFKIGVNFFFD